MRCIPRRRLPQDACEFLVQRREQAKAREDAGTLDIQAEWRSARSATRFVAGVLPALRAMAGECERCMYCENSEGCDVEHFWPKAPYPGRAFDWLNLLLCCAPCNRLKDDRFPLDESGRPLLVDPTAEDPWDFLVYEPKLGFLTAQFDRDANRFDPKGHATVEILGLNRRGAVAVGLRRSYRRISEVVSAHLLRTEPWPVDDLAQAIILADEHGLIEWCFRRDGRNDPPFSTLREREPDVWTRLIELLP